MADRGNRNSQAERVIMLTNMPEKQHFERIMCVEQEIAERRIDLKELWASAKDDLDKGKLADLKIAVKRALTDRDKLDAKREQEDRADDLIKALGDFRNSPLGDAAVRAAQ